MTTRVGPCLMEAERMRGKEVKIGDGRKDG